jgi:phytoene dehydrogenase-like protein
MNKIFSETIVIGAGASGLALTHLLRGLHQEVLCLEAHHLPGGSAGYFSRGKFAFDVGATTLSGMDNNGPLKRFLEMSKLSPSMRKIDPGIVIGFKGKKLRRYADTSSWVNEQNILFQHQDLDALWNRLQSVNVKAWQIADASSDWPPYDANSFMRLFSSKLPAKLSLLPYLLTSFEEKFDLRKAPPEFKRFLNELLLISTQSTMERVPALMGVMGLCYPEDTWYPNGGMRGFFQQLSAPIKDFINFGTVVLSIRRVKDFWQVETANKTYSCRRLVSTAPIWNTYGLLGVKIDLPEEKESWGALTGYYKIKLKAPQESLYHQVHCDKISYGGSGSLFLSLSHPEDMLRADGVSQTLTVSTHIRHEKYLEAIKANRSEMRRIWDEEFKEIISIYFGEDLLNLESVGLGDPDTFMKYTLRERVGGIPHSLRRNFLTYPKNTLPFPNLYQLGDTTFPGQGVVGVIQGAMNLSRRIGSSSL